MTSLAAQLAQTASLNTALLADRSKRKPTESYLFTGRDADQHDLDAIFALGTNGFLQLCSLEPRLKHFESELFSDRAKALDRTLLGKEEDEKLSGIIKEFLGLLGPWLLESPTSRVVEWLVRRFRINEFDVESLLALFLPYHDTPQFAKLVTILHIRPSSTWSFLLPFKSAAQSLPRVSLVTEMLRNTDVSRFVALLLPSALKEKRCHRVLLAFNAATMHEFISRSKSLDEGTITYVLSALLEPLEKRSTTPKDAILGSYILLSALSHKCNLSSSAVKHIVGYMAACADAVATKQFISAVIAVCEPQTELEHFSSSTVKALLKLPDLKEELQNAVGWVGSEKLIRPLIPGLISRLPASSVSVLLESIISTPIIPVSVLEHATYLLLKGVLSGNESDACRSMLSIIQQRHPDIFQTIVRRMEEEGKEEQKQTIERLVLSLSLASTNETQSKENLDMILASTNADTNVRVMAVKQLLSSLSSLCSAPEEEQKSIVSALLSRLQDPEQPVLEALYDKPILIVPVLINEAPTYIRLLREVLSVKTKRSFLRLHLNFVTKYLYPELSPKQKEEIVSDILFPFLLFSKPRQHTAETVWDIISENLGQETGMEFETLKGCAEVVKAERTKVVEDQIEQMKSINSALSTRIAQNILRSNQIFELLPLLFSWLESSNPHTRCLGYLIAQALLTKFSGEHQVSFARNILSTMKVDQIGGMDDLPAEDDQFNEILKEMPEKNVVLKPTKHSTLSWLQISLVATICEIAPPSGLILNWLSDLPLSPTGDARNYQYVGLMRSVYRLANCSSSLPVIMSTLLRVLFLNLKNDTLAFLAGVWTAPMEEEGLHEIALRHAAAFLEAHVLEDDAVDFQTILPALLDAFQHPAVPVRKAALECLSRLRLLTERKLRSVYKFDTIYGEVKDVLQYLDQDDFKKYISYLVSHQQHIFQDNTYLRIMHGEHLRPAKGDKKKESEYKNRVLCYLLSHVNGIDLLSAKVKLLESLSLVATNDKVIELLPELETLKKPPSTRPDQLEEKLTCLLLSCVDSSSVPQLNGVDGTLWNFYLQILKKYLNPGGSDAPREIIIRLLENEIFTKLTIEKQVILSELVIEIAVNEPDSQSYCKKLLSNIVKDVPVIVRLLTSLAPVPQSSPRASKRAKTTESAETSHSMSKLSLLAEILGTKPLSGSLDVVSVLLDTLGKVVQTGNSASPADINYIQQLLMSGIDSAASNILEAPNITPSVIRLDILVEVIRVAGNPQTFHQALLLIASLARLAPESVLHNVMPVFTFMGSNIFHRDDTYSFRVVQKTIDGIVPVMAFSLKKAHTKSLDLYVASRDFLRVFTEAANHIPRHRRNNFFVHLVEALGPDFFLAPVCMLLAVKSSNRVAKQNRDEASNTLSLPITLLRHFPPGNQITALVEMIQESQRLLVSASDPSHKGLTFLDHITDEEPALLSSTYTKRALVLVILIGQTIQPSTTVNLEDHDRDQLSVLVSELITLSTSNDHIPETKRAGFAATAQMTLKKILASMPVVDFTAAVVSMLQNDNKVACIGALDLLYERLPKIADQTRREVSPVIVVIVDMVVKLLTRDDMDLKMHCLMGLEGVALTLMPKEETPLTAALPSIVGVLSEPDLVVRGLQTLLPLTTKLGPRIIPFFKDIVSHGATLLKSEDEGIVAKTAMVFHGLLASIPGFWGSDAITQMVNIYIDHCLATSGSPRSVLSSLIKAITKKIPSTVLLPTLLNGWPRISSTLNLIRISAYFDILIRTLRNATRVIVLEQIRLLSKTFLEALDIAKSSIGEENKVEIQIISAFKEFVIKLNESTFRPIFRQFYDWAFVHENGILERKIIFFHVYSSLLDFFKVLMVPYTSFVLQAFITHLTTFTGSDGNPYLWISLITTLTKSLTYDDGAFWRNDRLRQVGSLLIQQLPFCFKLPAELNSKTTFQECLETLVDNISDDAVLKSINLDILMHTRSENTKIRQFALTCSESLWRAHGSKLLGFVAETATFISECGEDENDMVVQGSFRLKDAVESIAGKIDGL